MMRMRGCSQCLLIDTPTFYLRGLIKLKKNLKSKKNSDWPDSTHGPHIHFFNFFWRHIQQEQNNNKKQKTQNFQKKSGLGLDPPTHFRVFLGFLDFFNLTKPLSCVVVIAGHMCHNVHRAGHGAGKDFLTFKVQLESQPSCT